MLNLKPMSAHMRMGWYFASFVYGLCVVAVASTTLDDFHLLWAEAPAVPVTVFATAWIAGVLLLRLYLNGKDKIDFRDVLRLR